MAKSRVGNDEFNFESMLFSDGKERITVNGNRAFEGQLNASHPAKFTVGATDYEFVKEKPNYRITAKQGASVLYEGLYNGQGMEVGSPDGASTAKAVQVCTVIGFICGLTFMIGGNILTGVIPGGAIGGAIGGGGGAALGGLIGKEIFVKQQPETSRHCDRTRL